METKETKVSTPKIPITPLQGLEIIEKAIMEVGTFHITGKEFNNLLGSLLVVKNLVMTHPEVLNSLTESQESK